MSPSHRPRLWTVASALLLLAVAGAWAAKSGAGTKHNSKPAEAAVQPHSPLGLTEVGMLDGAPYRIDIPNDWNHNLVVY